MTTDTKPQGLRRYLHTFVSALFVMALVMGTFALAGCRGSSDEQDNCYGEDMPVVNEKD